ncbi:hypothetical protein ES708_12688 [subsurface metagenome]
MHGILNTGKYSHITDERLNELLRTYREGLLEDTVPFWIRHSIDREYGGYVFNLDRDGSILDTDKAIQAVPQSAWGISFLG